MHINLKQGYRLKREGEVINLGYILPISQYEYTNYQAREIKDKKQIKSVTKPYKVILEAEEKMLNNKYKNVQGKLNAHKRNLMSKRIPPSKQIDVMHYARLTGKGGIINEVI